MKQATIEMLTAKASAYEASARAETTRGNAEAAAGYQQIALMFLEALGKADTMDADQFAEYAKQCLYASWQWEDTVGPDADIEYEPETIP